MRTQLLVIFIGSLLVYLLPPLPANAQRFIQALWLAGVWLFITWRILALVANNTHMLLARLGWRTRRAPAAYVRALFDDYAERFDEHLMVDLRYNAPNLVRSLVGQRLDAQTHPVVADLGCGTGICGPLFADLAEQLIGVDLSPEMLQRAAERGIYDALHEDDLLRFLRRHREAFDLCIAADVFVYLGDLHPVLAACTAALRQGGYLVFTVERTQRDDWTLERTGRYAHPRGYIETLATRMGLQIEVVQEAVLRTQSGKPVMGDGWLLRKGSLP